MNATNIEDLKGMGGIEAVELSGWVEDKPFICELKRVSLYEMMAADYVPNPLIPVIQDQFMGMQKALKGNMTNPEDAKGFLAIARAAMVNPTYEQVKAAGLMLTDQQVLEIFFFATRGAQMLATFRGKQGGGANSDGGEIQEAAV